MDEAAFREAVLTLRSTLDVRDYLAEAEADDASSSSSSTTTSSSTAAPWSQAGYYRRLRTFTPQTWFGKPLSAVPPRCAAHGWVNAGVDQLRCAQCGAALMMVRVLTYCM